jgi:hypothetical protein
MWVIAQLPPSLASDGRSMVRTMTAAQLDDVPTVTEACIDIVAAANDSNRNFREITEMIGAVVGDAPEGRRPAGLGRGRGRGDDQTGRGRGRGAAGGKGAGGRTAGGRAAGGRGGAERATTCSVLPPRGPTYDRAHTGECWRDPKCQLALPAWMMACRGGVCGYSICD